MSINGIGSGSYYNSLIYSSRNHQAQESGAGQESQRGKSQEAQAASIFNKLDEDGSGGVSSSELSSLVSRVNQLTGQSLDVDSLFSSFDDGDGELSEDETKAVLESLQPQGPPSLGKSGPGSGLEDIITAADEDGDGVLSESEMESIATMISGATGTGTSASDLIAGYDEDGDSALNEDEAMAAVEANRPEGPPPMMGMGGGAPPSLEDIFIAADEDDDGSLSTTETESLVEMINNAAGASITAADLVAGYDSDEDGLLNQDETVSALEANRPASQRDQTTDSESMRGIDQYMRVASMGGLFSRTEDGSAASFLGVNTKV